MKAFKAINKNVVKFGDARDLADYTYTYVMCRELARGDFVYNLKNAKPEIRTEYSAVRANNYKIYTYVFSVRSIMIDNNAMSVVM
jgi:hypothetical protein